MLISALIDRFLAWHAEHNKPATAVFYRQGLRWLREQFGAREWADLTRDELKTAMAAANLRPDGEPWANDTIRRNVIALEQLQRWAHEQELIEAPLLRKLDLKKPGGRRREVIPTDEEIGQILAKATPAFRLALASLRQSGMRPGELSKATIEKIDKGKAIVIDDHKTARKIGKPRRIAIGGKMAELVKEAIAGRDSGPIWLDERGRPWTTAKLSQKFRMIRNALGLSPELVLYSHRHFFATQVTRKCGIAAAQHALGHRNISTTQRYNHPDDEDQRAAQDVV